MNKWLPNSGTWQHKISFGENRISIQGDFSIKIQKDKINFSSYFYFDFAIVIKYISNLCLSFSKVLFFD